MLAVALSSCAPPSDFDSSDVDAMLGRALRQAENLERLAAAGVSPDPAVDVELAYLERLRLGMGSPFRLMELALNDERLPETRRRALAAALLGRTADGAAYRIDPVALDMIDGPDGPKSGSGVLHLRLITDAVREADDPRAGELAIRLAYLLSQAEWATGPQGARQAIQAAGLVRDRELARHDAERLIDAAEESGRDVFHLLRLWRAHTAFEVERPTLVGSGHSAERYAMRAAPRLARTIRGLADASAARERSFRPAPSTPLPPDAARRLLERSDSAPAPPQAPVGVVVRAAARGAAGAPSIKDPAHPVLLSARTEERYAAAYALLRGLRPNLKPFLERTSVWVASAMRPLAQEAVTHTGPAPSSRELADEFGLAAVEFAPSVPAEWRPHYRRVLYSALLDIQRVLPALDLRGLTIHLGPVPGGQSLALHDPRSRTIYFPPETGVGTLAHEIAHDLDWQVALRRYRVRGDYGSDRGVRQPRDRLAATYSDLTGAVLSAASPVPVERAAHQTRPAEIFARSVDWLVATSLAREGRVNGYLSSVQDDLLTGYGTVASPDISGRAGAALVEILDEVAPLRARNRTWFLETYGPGRAHSATDLVRQVTRAGMWSDSVELRPQRARADPARMVQAVHAALDRPLEELRAAQEEAMRAICTIPGVAFDPELAGLRRSLIQTASTARARGLVKQHAGRLLGRPGVDWVGARFEPGPWRAPADTLRLALVEALVQEAAAFEPAAPLAREDPFRLLPEVDACASATPLLSNVTRAPAPAGRAGGFSALRLVSPMGM